MKTQYITNFKIIVSDEKINEGDLYNCMSKGKGIDVGSGLPKQALVVSTYSKSRNLCPNCKKIIAGLPGLPSIDYNGFEHRFGVINQDRIIVAAQQYALSNCKENMSSLTKTKIAYEAGFKACQELYGKMYSEEDINYALSQLIRASKGERGDESTMKDFLNEAKQSQSIDIEVEDFYNNLTADEIIEIEKDLGIYGHDEGLTESELSGYKSKNPKIRITKVL